MIKSEVQLIKDEFVLVSLKAHSAGRLAYLPAKRVCLLIGNFKGFFNFGAIATSTFFGAPNWFSVHVGVYKTRAIFLGLMDVFSVKRSERSVCVI